MAKHKLSHHDEVKGGEHSHAHHAKMAKHHLGELHKMAKKSHKHPEKSKKHQEK